MIRRLKIVISKVMGNSRAASILSTIYLIREHSEDSANMMMNYCLKECPDLKEFLSFKKRLYESMEEKDIILKSGKYTYKNEELIIEQDLHPIAKYFGYNIYEINGKERMVFLKEELK